ncbi:MAG: hypothetical protein VKL42_12570 [Snowella sp.]|nr:hypothetical protein [Snowella sp.]
MLKVTYVLPVKFQFQLGVIWFIANHLAYEMNEVLEDLIVGWYEYEGPLPPAKVTFTTL